MWVPGTRCQRATLRLGESRALVPLCAPVRCVYRNKTNVILVGLKSATHCGGSTVVSQGGLLRAAAGAGAGGPLAQCAATPWLCCGWLLGVAPRRQGSLACCFGRSLTNPTRGLRAAAGGRRLAVCCRCCWGDPPLLRGEAAPAPAAPQRWLSPLRAACLSQIVTRLKSGGAARRD